MNEMQDCKSLEESEAVIKSNENFIGIGLWNIGSELKYIRDNRTYEEKGYFSFEEYAGMELDYSRRHAYNFIEIAEKYNVQSIAQVGHLGITKLVELGKIEKEDRREFIEENPVEDMTTRELRQAIKEKRELEKQVEELKNQEPKVIEVEKEVYPSDYLDKQKRIEELQEELRNQIDPIEYERLRKELTDKNLELYDIKQQMEKEKVTIEESKEVHLKKLKDTAIVFSNRVHNFINDVGGLGWLIEYLDEIPSYEQEEYTKAIELLDRWVTTIKSNL